MNRSGLIEHMAHQADICKAAAKRALDAFVGGSQVVPKQEGGVTGTGFGTFSVTQRRAGAWRNPHISVEVRIKGAKVRRFRPGKGLKDFLN